MQQILVTPELQLAHQVVSIGEVLVCLIAFRTMENVSVGSSSYGDRKKALQLRPLAVTAAPRHYCGPSPLLRPTTY